jgi:molybdenum cofactor synthesis domain-containing protein
MAGGPLTLRAKVLTVSDGVADGSREDRSGSALVTRLEDAGFEVADHRVTPDGRDAVAEALRELTDGFAGLVVTTGGTGFGPRDVTPEGTRAVIEREAPGLAEAMRRVSDGGDRAFGMPMRGICGVTGKALVCNLPGSSSGAVECLEAVLPAMPHALELLAGARPH